MKVIAFDLFGTVFDLSETPRDEVRAYLDQCVDPVWKPLELPESWNMLPAFPDSKEGIERLKSKYRVATLSNAPLNVTLKMLQHNSIEFHGVSVLAEFRRYKPHPECYQQFADWWGVPTSDVLMVTANPTFGPYPFGDLEIAGAIGMKTQLIRNPGCPQTIIELAEQLGC